jgi:hypothetical protein
VNQDAFLPGLQQGYSAVPSHCQLMSTLLCRERGKDNANADMLSRLQLPEMPATTVVPREISFLMERLSKSPVNAKQIKQWTDRDPLLAQLKRILMQGWPPVVEDEGLRPCAKYKTELSVQDGCILLGVHSGCSAPWPCTSHG